MVEKVVMMLCLGAVIACITGCATSQQLAKNLAGKSLVGNGFVSVQKVVLTEPETGTYTPEISSLLVDGEFQTILKDSNFLRYERKESSSVFNASCKTTTETLTINLKENANMSATVEKVKDYIKAQAEIAAKKKEAETAGTASATK